MRTVRGFVRFAIFSVFELITFDSRCCADQSYEQKVCYEVGYNVICFFRPQPHYKWLTWQDAFQTCRRSNATLPTIHSQEEQDAFEKYMDFLKLVDKDDFWMAGNEFRQLEWKWLNGRTANLPERQLNGSMADEYVQGVLTNNMLYATDVPSSRNHFVCQLNGTACRLNVTGSVALSNGCLFIISNKTLNLYNARNQCVKEGGDLVVIDNQNDLQRFREVITRIPNVVQVWIGLRRQWWAWAATEHVAEPIVEVKYSNWLPNNGFKSSMECMKSEMKGYKWQQEPCNSTKLFVCQTVVTISPTKIPLSFSATTPVISFTAFAAFGILILIVTVIIIVIIVKKKRNARQKQSTAVRVRSDRSYQDLHDRQENQYTELQMEPNPDYQNLSDYDDTLVTRIPSYLNIIA